MDRRERKPGEKGVHGRGSRRRGFPGPPLTRFVGGPRVELREDREAAVEGCRSVLRCDEEMIRLDLGAVQVSFSGEGLSLSRMDGENTVIEGKIRSVTLTR